MRVFIRLVRGILKTPLHWRFWVMSTPLLYFLWTQPDLAAANDAFGFWIRGLMTVDAESLVEDVADMIRYAAGDWAETIEGL